MTHVNATVESLKREFEKIVAEKNPIMLANRTHDKSKQWNDCYYCHPNTTQATTLVKRIQALSKVDAARSRRSADAHRQSAHAQAGRGHGGQGRRAQGARNEKKAAPCSSAKRPSEQEEPLPHAPPGSGRAAQAGRRAIPVEGRRLETQRLTNQVEEIKRLGAMFGSFDPAVVRHQEGRPLGQPGAAQQADGRLQFLGSRGHDLEPQDERGWYRRSKAERFAEDMVTAFIYKVGTKLSGIVEKKGNLAKAFIRGSLQDHWMTFEFRDGASFEVQSQIVWKTSVNGVHFAQYPTCFRNVKLAVRLSGKWTCPARRK
jgi:hypothetical protein